MAQITKKNRSSKMYYVLCLPTPKGGLNLQSMQSSLVSLREIFVHL